MELLINDRIELNRVFKLVKGSISEILLKKAISEKIEFSDIEKEAYKITYYQNGGYQYQGELKLDINLTDDEEKFLIGIVDSLDKNQAVTDGNLDLCLKIKALEKAPTNETNV